MGERNMKILVIATLLPPYRGSANIRALNYINYLSRMGHQVDVLGVKYPTDSLQYDESLENVFESNVNVYRIGPGALYKLFYQKKNKTPSLKATKQKKGLFQRIKPKINSFIRNNVLILDSYIQWIKPAYKMAVSLQKKNQYDCIFSMHETPSSHIVAYKLKKKFNYVKWISYWSDPWIGDSLRSFSKARLLIERFLEKKIINNADKFLFTSIKTKEMYRERYNIDEKKLDIVYRGFDDRLYSKISCEKADLNGLKKEKINIVYLGTIYRSLRDITPFYEALVKLKEKNYEVFSNLNILFIGSFDNKEDESKLGELENVQIIPPIPHYQALRYIVKADVLLLLGNKKSTQIPGKVYEYLGSKAIILTILGDETDELSTLMGNINKGPVILNNSDEIIKSLNDIYFSIKNRTNNEWNQVIKQFTWENVVRDLESKLKT
jgi:glycosyltransferase involved in cell wall biosynthesis